MEENEQRAVFEIDYRKAEIHVTPLLINRDNFFHENGKLLKIVLDDNFFKVLIF